MIYIIVWDCEICGYHNVNLGGIKKECYAKEVMELKGLPHAA